MAEKRIFRPRNRLSGTRDAKLIVIAAEGSQTERIYFNDLASPQYYYNPRIHVEVLANLTTASAPEKIITLLDQFRREYRLKKGYDELWLVLDMDRWKEVKISSIAQSCQQKNYDLAISNPCFELWLLLHIKSLDEYEPKILVEFRENKKQHNRTRLEQELLALLGSYNKSNPDTSKFLPHIHTAIQRARELDKVPEHRWPNDLGSRVYILAEKIIKK